MNPPTNAAVARRCVDRVLAGLGQPSLGDNPKFREEHIAGRDFVFVLQSQDAAPLRLEFGYELEVGVGPFSEVYAAVPDNEDELERNVRRILTSQVRVEHGPRTTRIAFVDPGDGTVWWKASFRSLWRTYQPDPILEPEYPPAFSIGP